jgi:hypothetical protein
VTAPKLRFSLVRKGKLSETRASEPNGSPIASWFGSTSGDSVAYTADTTDKISAMRTVSPKRSEATSHGLPNLSVLIDEGNTDQAAALALRIAAFLPIS